MSALVLSDRDAARLRVAIVSPDPMRRRGLAAIVASSGHELVEPESGPDIVVSDGKADIPAGAKLLALGSGDAGAAGLLPSDASAAQIDAALRAIAVGLVVRAPHYGQGLAAAMFEPMAEPPQALLSPRELEILGAIGEGLSNKAVARRLGISPHTVKFHVESLFRKLGAVSRADAVAKGLRHQIIEL
jgi:DNA-binding CsgD family transcriptional regulator